MPCRCQQPAGLGAIARRFPRFGVQRGLGQSTSSNNTWWNAVTQTWDNPIGTLYAILPATSGETPWSYVVNAATGHMSQSQAQTLAQQEAQQLITAGMDPTDAATQAQSDVSAALQQAGASPITASSVLGGALTSSLPTWVWLLLIGAGVYVAYEVL
ncbi:MAG: hypothetical protein ACRD3D_13215 [Terriglobia bacterium]